MGTLRINVSLTFLLDTSPDSILKIYEYRLFVLKINISTVFHLYKAPSSHSDTVPTAWNWNGGQSNLCQKPKRIWFRLTFVFYHCFKHDCMTGGNLCYHTGLWVGTLKIHIDWRHGQYDKTRHQGLCHKTAALTSWDIWTSAVKTCGWKSTICLPATVARPSSRTRPTVVIFMDITVTETKVVEHSLVLPFFCLYRNIRLHLWMSYDWFFNSVYL